jgi:hypothetical protein
MKKLVKFLCGVLSLAAGWNAQADSNSVTVGQTGPVLSWDALSSPYVAGYSVKYGTIDGASTNSYDAKMNVSATLSSLTAGKTNFIYVVAYNSQKIESQPSTILYYYPVVSGAKPSITLASPVSGAVYTNVSSLNLTATVSSQGGTISKIEFYNGGAKIGEVASAISYTWSSVPAGSLNLWAKVTDSTGATQQSTTNAVTIYSYPTGDLAAPSVAVASPTAGQAVLLGKAVTLTASASAGNGSISKVEFYVNNSLVATTKGTFSTTWTPSAAGTYSVVAKAYTAANYAASSSAVAFVSYVNHVPVATVTSPAAGTSFGYGPSVTIQASATDSDPGDSVAKLEIYVDGVLKGSAASSACTATWTSPASGSHVITAKATDSNGGVGASSSVTVTVQTPQVVLWQRYDGTYADYSSLSLPVVLKGTATYGTGVKNQAIQLASGSYLALTTVSSLAFGSQDFTAEAWINPASIPTSGQSCLISHNSRSAGGLWLVYSSSAVSLQWGTALSASVSLTKGAWNHVAAVRQGTNLVLYANGKKVGSTTYTGSFMTSTGPVWIGQYGTSYPFSGMLDEMKITLGFARYSGSTYSAYIPASVGAAGSLASTANDTVATSPARGGVQLTRNATSARLRFAVRPGEVYSVQASSDLKAWVTIETVHGDAETTHEFSDPDAASSAMRFYRVVPSEVAVAAQ